MANHLTAMRSKSNSHMEATTEEEASKIEVEDAHMEATEKIEVAIAAEVALMGPEEILETDLVAALIAVKRDI